MAKESVVTMMACCTTSIPGTESARYSVDPGVLCSILPKGQFFIGWKLPIFFMTKPIPKTVNVSEKGQITIPKDIQKAMGIKKGDRLAIVVIKHKILIQRGSEISGSIAEGFGDIAAHSENALKGVWDNKGDDVWGRYLQ